MFKTIILASTAALGLTACTPFEDSSFISVWYALRYGVHLSDVQTDTRPGECDYNHAPLGYKGCRYQALVIVRNADGVIVAGDSAPKYSHDVKTAKPIISYDEGKTWSWYQGDAIPRAVQRSIQL
jgi:hypothetical protein